MAKPSRTERGKATFTGKEKLILHGMIASCDLQSLLWMKTRIDEAVTKRENKLSKRKEVIINARTRRID